MNFQQMEYFKVIAELEHMSKAAQVLNVSQPNLSYAIAELEKELNVPLFEKQGRNIQLTRYGKFFLKYVIRSLNEIESGIRDVKSLVSPNMGTIEFAYYHSLGSQLVPDLVKRFYKLEDTSAVKFSLHQHPTGDIIEGLKRNDFDLALASYKKEPKIEFVPIFKQELLILVSKDHPLAGQKALSLTDIKDENFIAYSHHSELRPLIDEMLEKVGIKPNIVCEAVDNETVTGLVASNLGVAVSPRIFGMEMYHVKTFPIKKSLYKRYLYLLWRNDKYLSPVTQRFRDFILEQMAL